MTTAHRFGHFQHHFADLSLRVKVKTNHDINSIIISNDERFSLVLMQPAINRLEVMVLEIGDDSGDARMSFHLEGQEILRAQALVQNEQGTVFALPYFNSGSYMVRIFDLGNDCIEQVLDINRQLGISTN